LSHTSSPRSETFNIEFIDMIYFFIYLGF
jgi:hypothetical protein